MEPMKKNPSVSVIVPVLNDSLQLKKCIEALSKQTYSSENIEIIIVDNGPCAEVQNLVRQYPQCILEIKKERGPNFARGAGIKRAKGDVIALTDADCIPDTEWIERGISYVIHNTNCGMVGGKVQMIPRDKANVNCVEAYDCLLYLDQYKHIIHQKFAATANAFIPRFVLDAISPLDIAYHGSDDEEIGRRIHEAGFAMTYAPDAIVYHPAQHTFSSLWRRTQRNMKGKIEFYRHQDCANSFMQFLWNARSFFKLHINHDLKCLYQASSIRKPIHTLHLYYLWLILHTGCGFKILQEYTFPLADNLSSTLNSKS